MEAMDTEMSVAVTDVAATATLRSNVANFSKNFLDFSNAIGDVQKKHRILTIVIRVLLMYVIIMGCVLADGGMSEQVACYFKNVKCPWRVGAHSEDALCTIEDITELNLDYSTRIYGYAAPLYLAMGIYVVYTVVVFGNLVTTNISIRRKYAQASAQVSTQGAQQGIAQGLAQGAGTAISVPGQPPSYGTPFAPARMPMQPTGLQLPQVPSYAQTIDMDSQDREREFRKCLWTIAMHFFGSVAILNTVIMWPMRYAQHISAPWWTIWLSTLIFLFVEFVRFCYTALAHHQPITKAVSAKS